MFGKLEECVGKNIYIKYWKDGKLVSYEGILNSVAHYRYIVIDRKNFLLFFAVNGAIASITCGDEVVYETKYVGDIYYPIKEDDSKELERRELECFDDEYRDMLLRSTEEYFLKRGKELLSKGYYVRWEKFVRENIDSKYQIIKAVVDIVDLVQSGNSYYIALIRVFGSVFDYSLNEIAEVNEIVANYFSDSVYEYTDFAVFMLHHAGIKKMEEKNNMKQLININNVYVSLAN